MNILDIFLNSLLLIINLDKNLWNIILLSLNVSVIALTIGSLIGLFLGYFLAIKKFFLKNILLIFINSLMGIPPVVVGLIVYFLFARGGPLGVFELLYTPKAMIIAQSIIIFPIVTSLSHEIFLQNWNNFKDEFRNIINQHSVADKSPMISLSGGIDSYIIMNNFVNNRKYSTSYTLGFENESYDESKYVKKIDKNITKKIFNTNDELLKSNFIKISKLLNEPVGDSSIVPTFIIQEKIGIDSNVSLGGDGGDESFFGYITFDAFYLATKLKKFIPNFIFSIIKLFTNLFRGSSGYISQTTKIRRFFNSIDLNEKYLLPSWLGCLDIKNLKKLFNENLLTDQIYNEMNDIFNKTGNKMRYAQIYHYKYYLPMILSKIDQASMFNSVESRSPFLSKKIINFGLSQDVNKLYKLFKKKLFIREVFRSEIPNEILNRKKHGFAFPKDIILKDKKFINNLINHKLLINKDFFDIKYDNYLNKNEDCGQYIWNELILNLTLQNLKINKLF